MSQQEYVLGTGNDELERLGIQHRIWADVTVAAWKTACIKPGQTVLDLGSGPGHATFDLAQLITHKGKIVALDESEGFIQHIQKQAQARGLKQIEALQGDVQELEKKFSANTFDAVYCRWVLCWLEHPQKTLEGIKKILKPNGKLIIHDYFNWKTMTLAPRSKSLDQVVSTTIAAFEERKGDIDIAARLPKMLEDLDLKIEHFQTHQRVARGGGKDSTIYWPLTWWKTFTPKLVEQQRLSEEVAQKALADLSELETNPNLFFVCPTVYEFIAIK
jgi:ubiquinone/menaquinone biosynthesis C-methylase UbiE